MMDSGDEGQSATPTGTPDARPIVVDIPGVGPRAFPATMPPAQIQANAKALQQAAMRVPAAGRSAGGFDVGKAQERTIDMLTDPEMVAGAASFIPGVGTGAAAGIGAATSVGRDLVQGRTDPVGMTLRAGGHAAVNAIPGMVGGMVAKRVMPKAAEVGVDMATHGPVRGGIVAGLRALVGAGQEAAPAAVAAVDELAGMELAGGIKVLSPEGLKKLVQTSIDLDNAGAPRAQVKALDDLISKVAQRVTTQGATPAAQLTKAGLQPTTAVARQAATAAAKGTSVSNRLRLALGLGSETYEAEKQR